MSEFTVTKLKRRWDLLLVFLLAALVFILSALTNSGDGDESLTSTWFALQSGTRHVTLPPKTADGTITKAASMAGGATSIISSDRISSEQAHPAHAPSRPDIEEPSLHVKSEEEQGKLTLLLPAPRPKPVAPVAPVAPLAPAKPVAPIGPTKPVGPVAPVAPVAPMAPVAPVTPNSVAPEAREQTAEQELNGNNPGSTSILSNLALTSLPRIAVAIQGKAHGIPRWHAVLEALSTRRDVALFGLIWNGVINQNFVADWINNNSHVKIFNETKGSWTEGRNFLAKAIYSEEVARGKQFHAWMFIDSDMWYNLKCSRCPITAPLAPEGPACCLDYLFTDVILNGQYNFPTISSSTLEEERGKLRPLMSTPAIDSTFIFRDCADAQLQVFHREAVPALLPYHADLDERSWWSSQSMLFQYLSGCLPGSNVLLGRDFDCTTNEHNPYPRGSLLREEERDIVSKLFPALMVFPLNISTNPAFAPSTCLKYSNDIRTLDPANPKLPDWRHSEAFLKCLNVKESYFLQMVGQGVPSAPAYSLLRE